MSHPKLEELLRRDSRYPYEAYEFVFKALAHTQQLREGKKRKGAPSEQKQHHVNGVALLHGVRDLALREFGLMARVVFRQWGINTTDDIGEIVFNLIDAELMSKTDEDQRSDFHNVYDMDQALTEGYDISGRPQDENDP